MLTLNRADYGSSLLPDFTGEEFADVTSVPMAVDGWLQRVAEELEITLPPVSTGAVVLATPIEGAQFIHVGGSGEAFYYDETGFPDRDLVATTSFGWGGLLDIEPGEAQIEIVGDTEGCAVEWGWPSDADNRFRVPIWEGYYTYASFACE